MASPARTLPWSAKLPSPLPADELPILYQEEEDDGMGEANLHVLWTYTLFHGLQLHLADRPELRVYSNLNVYYRKEPLHPETRKRPNVAADTMVVQPFAALPENIDSYTIDKDGPAPLLAAEILSKRTARKRDLKQKLDIYGGLAVAEYLIADPTRRFVPDGLLLKRLQPDRTWSDFRDADGGVTSQLGFRVIMDSDEHLRVIDTTTGWPYPRPHEAGLQLRQAEMAYQQEVELRKRAEAELAELRRALRDKNAGK